MAFEDPYDVVVIGAGVIGCATARELATDHDVLVLDKGGVATETTAKASGLITVVPDVPEHPDAARYAASFFESYDGTGDFEVTPRSSVHLATAEEESWARSHADSFVEKGFEVTYRTASELEERFPGALVYDDFVGGIEFENTGWVDPYTYATTLATDAEDRGARFETGVAVEKILATNGEVEGVETTEGTVRASTVICAAGWRIRELVSDFAAVPLRPFRWQTVNLEVDRGLDDVPMAWDRSSRLYWRPERNGDLHVGGGTYYVEDPGSVRESATEAFLNQVAETIPNRVQDVEDARFASDDCCPTGDAATPDNLPIIDAPGPAGLVIGVAGPVGGIMCSPFIARAVRSLATGEDAPFPLEPHGLSRFDDRSAAFDCEYVTGWGAPAAQQ